MARIKLTLSANAGGTLQLGEHRILIDALHKTKLPGFSTLNHNLQQDVFAHPDFMHPEWICVTHNHPDHYSQELIDRAMALWPDSQLCLPEDKLHFVKEDLQLRYLPLVHDGAAYENIPHYGLLITWKGKNILVSGDCRVADEALVSTLKAVRIDLAIMNFPWLTLKKGRSCLQSMLQPGTCVFWHLPFADDDVNGYRRSAEAVTAQYPAYLLYNPLQTIEIDI